MTDLSLDDVLALQALPQRYARAADDRDVDALAALFDADATIRGIRGPQSLDAWLDTMRSPRSFPTSMHVLGAPLIDANVDGTVTLDTYAVVHQLGDRDTGQSDLTLGIRYVDRVVRRDDGTWSIAERTATTLWIR